MARSDRIFKSSYNKALDQLLYERDISSISGLARHLDISRNTARRVFQALKNSGILATEKNDWKVTRPPTREDYFPEKEVLPIESVLETAFMEWTLKEEIGPGTRFSEAAIARKLGASPSSVREFLLRLSKHGFIRKEPQKSWVLEGFTRAYAEEIHEVRLLFELRTIEKLVVLAEDDPFWPSITRMMIEHRELLENYEQRYLDFPKLDARFHRLLNSASRNRFIESFQDVISLIFHYHYRWNKADEKERNYVALQEHLRVIEAIILRKPADAKAALGAHLETAQLTLTKSIEW